MQRSQNKLTWLTTNHERNIKNVRHRFLSNRSEATHEAVTFLPLFWCQGSRSCNGGLLDSRCHVWRPNRAALLLFHMWAARAWRRVRTYQSEIKAIGWGYERMLIIMVPLTRSLLPEVGRLWEEKEEKRQKLNAWKNKSYISGSISATQHTQAPIWLFFFFFKEETKS